jgi:hypothetical protein
MLTKTKRVFGERTKLSLKEEIEFNSLKSGLQISESALL